jgi:hypothetical protein
MKRMRKSRTLGNETGNLHAHLMFEHIGQDGKYDGQDVHGIETGNHIRLEGWNRGVTEMPIARTTP